MTKLNLIKKHPIGKMHNKIMEFSSEKAMDNWIHLNSVHYSIDILFIHNKYAVEYKPLKEVRYKNA